MALAQAFVWGDLLASHQLKPYWETARAFGTLVMVVTDLLLLYALPSMKVKCTKVGGGNGTFQEAYVNELCAYQSFALVRHFWWFSVVFIGLIYVANNAWEFLPAVSRRVKSFRTAADLLTEMHLSAGFLKQLILRPNNPDTQEEEKTQKNRAREIWNLLDRYIVDSDYVVLTYKIRNSASLMVSFIYSVVLVCLLALHSSSFSCATGNSHFACVYSCHDVIIFVVGTHLFAALGQTIILGWVIYVIKEQVDFTFYKRLSRGFGESTLPRHLDDVMRGVEAAKLDGYEELRGMIDDGDVQCAIAARDYDFFQFIKATAEGDLSGIIEEARVIAEESGEDFDDVLSYLVSLNQETFPKAGVKLKKKIGGFFMWNRAGESRDPEGQREERYHILH